MDKTQVAPVSAMQRSYTAVFEKLNDGPVILTNRGSAAAVLLSVAEYDRQREQLSRYRRAALADERMADIEAGNFVTDEEVQATFAKMGLA